ncbi:hypothetical protein [Denitratisoma sp. DHT3]|uniref:hypothetical protein n=1 Tax=Denitratisoma sp. DHT3 TaxID=1981880 RepID=UPI0011A878BF|nr:hypothetical protein [Denitratisoma sp. DHT3]
MTSSLAYFAQSELALAAYANLTSGVPNRAELEKDSVGMSPIQSDQFSKKWNVICCIPCDHIPLRSWPLFRAREVMRGLIETLKAKQAT